jgi:hypothetical protein
MNDIAIKYNKLNKTRRQELNSFLDFLLTRQKKDKKNLLVSYKKKILSVSVWSDDDFRLIVENQKAFNQWKIQEW